MSIRLQLLKYILDTYQVCSIITITQVCFISYRSFTPIIDHYLVCDSCKGFWTLNLLFIKNKLLQFIKLLVIQKCVFRFYIKVGQTLFSTTPSRRDDKLFGRDNCDFVLFKFGINPSRYLIPAYLVKREISPWINMTMQGAWRSFLPRSWGPRPGSAFKSRPP